MRKIEMAILYGPSDGGGSWETLVVEVDAPDAVEHELEALMDHELEALGRAVLLDMESRGELGDYSGSYLFSYGGWLDEEE